MKPKMEGGRLRKTMLFLLFPPLCQPGRDVAQQGCDVALIGFDVAQLVVRPLAVRLA